jgi:dephospho-CoA kinase
MSAWPGKFVIGLTGNIATGKSVVRKMLEHLGAYGIDADALSHRAIAQGSPGYQAVIDQFGRWILDSEQQIDRARLGQIVFSSPQALAQLEAIVHPLVRQGIDILVRRAPHKVIVIEAIKLLEGDLRRACDSIWVTHAPPEAQLARLLKKRAYNEADARQRITSQASQQEKVAAADIVIYNTGSYENTWQQVSAAWQQLFPSVEVEPVEAAPLARDQLAVQRARPRQAAEIAEFITRMSSGRRKMSADDVMEAFGEKAYLLLKLGDRLVGLAGWQVENLVARVDDLFVERQVPLADAARSLLGDVEAASRELQCEAALLFLPAELARQQAVWGALGYAPRAIEQLGVRAWQDAARESMPPDSVMFFNQLRKDRVLRPV